MTQPEPLLTKLQRELGGEFKTWACSYMAAQTRRETEDADKELREIIANTLKQVSAEVAKMKKAIPECKCGSYENCCPHFEREDALTDVQRLLEVNETV